MCRGRSVCHPQLRVTVLIEAIEQHFVSEDRHVGQVRAFVLEVPPPRRARCAVSVPRPKPGEAVGVDPLNSTMPLRTVMSVGSMPVAEAVAQRQLLGSHNRAVGHPKAEMARRVRAVEQNTAIEDGHVGRVDFRSTPPR